MSIEGAPQFKAKEEYSQTTMLDDSIMYPRPKVEKHQVYK